MLNYGVIWISRNLWTSSTGNPCFSPRSDKLEDRFEGSYPELNINERPQKFLEKGASAEIAQTLSQSTSRVSKEFRRYVALNCWHMNSHESAAMWKLYMKSGEGIAIQSSYRKLIASFQKCEDKINVSLVTYVDYKKGRIPEGNMVYPFIHKRKSFEHEHEVRAIIFRYPPDGQIDFSVETIPDGGLYVPVDLDELICEVFVVPDSPPWLKRLVESVSRKYGIKSPVTQSILAESPVY
jgi:hypothetical protein